MDDARATAMHEREVVDAVVRYYEAALDRFGATARGVDWKDEASQAKRFEQLVRALRLDQRREPFSIVDFGCGYGALLPFLRARGLDCAYTGYDRSEKMIAKARSLHGVTFTSEWESVERADFIVASGVFNVRAGVAEEPWRDYVLRTLAAINEKAHEGFAVNFLTAYADADRKRDDLYYADPGLIFDWCKRNASRAVALLHDYELYEFTIGMVRRPW